MNDRTENQWRELNWRRDLTPAEQAELRAWLAAHPQARQDWEMEIALSQALKRLPEAPVPTNFTALVLHAVEGESARRERHHYRLPWLAWRRRLPWLPKLAFVGIILGGSLVSYHQVLAYQRAQLAKSVAAISDVTSLPSPQILTNFDAIQAMGRTPPADLELLRLLQ